MAILLLAVLLALVVVGFVLHPVLSGVEAPMERTDEDPPEAEFRKVAALRALRDVEYDYHTGKLEEADYASLRDELAREALTAIRALDRERPGRDASEAEAREALEAEIARYRARLRAGLTCPECQHPNGPGSRFCGQCGTELPLPKPGAEPSELEV